ncbi:MAG: DUF1905 domain-containing protein [Cryobacterium sp.]
MGPTFTFTAKLWEYEGKAAWTFVSMPADQAEDVRALTDGRRHGFGSVKVRAAINDSRWCTSVFPDSSRGTFILPVKKAIRVAEDVEPGDAVTVVLELVL